MRIELEKPYSDKWRKGYTVTNPEGRRTVILFNHSKDRSSVAYARYRLAVILGRFLTDKEEADHKDNDKTNDSDDNLQILSKADNIRKSIVPAKMLTLTCPVCACVFTRPARQVRDPLTRTCSPKCGGTYGGNAKYRVAVAT